MCKKFFYERRGKWKQLFRGVLIDTLSGKSELKLLLKSSFKARVREVFLE